ncbi:MAG: neutral zinc metallopeptidase [Verrucomicrobiota bacterium]
MRWEKLRRSRNIEDRRGQPTSRRPVAAGGGCGMLLLLLIVAVVFQVNPLELIGSNNLPPATPQTQQNPGQSDQLADFVAAIKGSTEEEWTKIFHQYGREYRPAKLINYSGSTPMPGGLAQSATGPFYLPANETIYLDTSFFSQLQHMARDRSDFDFACAYVIAHEVGHHVQKLLGYTQQVHSQRGRISQNQYNQLSVRLELQADFLAGIWAHHANARMQRNEGHSLLEEGDIEEAMRAAQAIGDDALQRSQSGRVVPDSFTHGTSAQRLRWFTRGLQSGDPNDGNTFTIPYHQL